MKPLPLELRQRIVDAIDQQLGTYAEIAEMFGVSERYLYKLLALRRATGDLAPKPHGGGAVAKLTDEQVLEVIDLVAEQPDATLDELRQRIKTKLRVSVCLATVSNVLARWGLPRKKSPAAPRQPTPKCKPLSADNNRRSPADG
jgi:transposase